MVRLIRSVRVSQGRLREALAWAKEMTGLLEKDLGASKIRVFSDAFGDVGTVRWMADYDSLAKLEEVQSRTLTNAGYWTLVKQAFEKNLFIDGSVNDVVLKEMS